MGTFNYAGWADKKTLQGDEMIMELQDAKENRRALMLISETGAGKTTALRLFNKKYAKHTYTVTVGSSWKPVDMLDAFMAELGLSDRLLKYDDRNARNKLVLIIKELKRLHATGAKLLLVIDESENLKLAFLEMIKELYDAIIEYCSIVLIGTRYILDILLNLGGKNRRGVPQLIRRWKAGIRFISEINKSRDFATFFEYIKQYVDLQDLLLKLAENYGELKDYLDPYLWFCVKRGKEPSVRDFLFFHKIKDLDKMLKSISK